MGCCGGTCQLVTVTRIHFHWTGLLQQNRIGEEYLISADLRRYMNLNLVYICVSKLYIHVYIDISDSYVFQCVHMVYHDGVWHDMNYWTIYWLAWLSPPMYVSIHVLLTSCQFSFLRLAFISRPISLYDIDTSLPFISQRESYWESFIYLPGSELHSSVGDKCLWSNTRCVLVKKW